MLWKTPVSNAWAPIFKITDFSKSSLKVTNLSKYYLFYLFKIILSWFFRKWCLLLVLNVIKENKEVKVLQKNIKKTLKY